VEYLPISSKFNLRKFTGVIIKSYQSGKKPDAQEETLKQQIDLTDGSCIATLVIIRKNLKNGGGTINETPVSVFRQIKIKRRISPRHS
jgi:hypothetical protein